MKEGESNMDLREHIRNVPGFPKPGIIFRDITPLLLHPQARSQAAEQLAATFADASPDVVVGIESRGFIIGSLVADRMGIGFGLVRKKGKLPYDTVQASYELEYGTDTVEMHTDAIARGQSVLVIDDLIATGGTAAATCELVEKVGGIVVGCGFVIELSFLNGRAKLADYRVEALIDYDAE